jgi:membrane protease YdiL (CAAX protease family)
MPHIFPCLLLFFYWTYRCLIVPSIGKKVFQKAPTAIPRRNYYTGAMLNYFCLAFIAIPAAAVNRIPVFGSIHIDLKLSLWAIGFLAVCMLLIDPLEWNYTDANIKQSLSNYIPRTAAERIAWFAVSLITAVSEEIVYRAVFFGIAYRLTGNYWAGGVISAVLFTIAHIRQGLMVLPSTFFVGLGLQYFVKLSGGLYVSIAIHFFHNYVNGIIYGELCKRTLERETAQGLSQEHPAMSDTSLTTIL